MKTQPNRLSQRSIAVSSDVLLELTAFFALRVKQFRQGIFLRGFLHSFSQRIRSAQGRESFLAAYLPMLILSGAMLLLVPVAVAHAQVIVPGPRVPNSELCHAYTTIYPNINITDRGDDYPTAAQSLGTVYYSGYETDEPYVVVVYNQDFSASIPDPEYQNAFCWKASVKFLYDEPVQIENNSRPCYSTAACRVLLQGPAQPPPPARVVPAPGVPPVAIANCVPTAPQVIDSQKTRLSGYTCDVDSDGDGAYDSKELCPADPTKTNPGTCGCGTPDTDSDSDGTADCVDGCAGDPLKTSVDICGCNVSDADSDSDGSPDCNDLCPSDPNKTAGGICGCGINDADSDNDGTADCNDPCDHDPSKVAEGICGCGISDTDSDGDGTADCNDGCPNDAVKTAARICGCSIADTDSDNDGTMDCNDQCSSDAQKTAPGLCGCGASDIDTDSDGSPDCIDECLADSSKVSPGICGCGVPDLDSDGDGTADCYDDCDSDPTKIVEGSCGCGISDADSDNDGIPDCRDGCKNDAGKGAPGLCGCGVSDVNSDSDGTPDCLDVCLNDPYKTAPGDCGCGHSDVDTDGDGTSDCNDLCIDDPQKIAPGDCGCGMSDIDSDGDGTSDCNDGCPSDPDKIAAGICGCGESDADQDQDRWPNCMDNCDFEANPDQADPNHDGIGVACSTGEEEEDDISERTTDELIEQLGDESYKRRSAARDELAHRLNSIQLQPVVLPALQAAAANGSNFERQRYAENLVRLATVEDWVPMIRLAAAQIRQQVPTHPKTLAMKSFYIDLESRIDGFLSELANEVQTLRNQQQAYRDDPGLSEIVQATGDDLARKIAHRIGGIVGFTDVQAFRAVISQRLSPVIEIDATVDSVVYRVWLTIDPTGRRFELYSNRSANTVALFDIRNVFSLAQRVRYFPNHVDSFDGAEMRLLRIGHESESTPAIINFQYTSRGKGFIVAAGEGIMKNLPAGSIKDTVDLELANFPGGIIVLEPADVAVPRN